MDEILWCDHSNETSSAVLLHGTICFSIFYKLKFGIFLEFSCLALLGLNGQVLGVWPPFHLSVTFLLSVNYFTDCLSIFPKKILARKSQQQSMEC